MFNDPKNTDHIHEAYYHDFPIKATFFRNSMLDEVVIQIEKKDYEAANAEIIKLRKDVMELKEYKGWAEVQLDADRQAFSNIQNTSDRREVIYNDGKRGWLLGWSTEDQFVNSNRFRRITVAIIECEDKKIKVVDASFIEFHDWCTEGLNGKDGDSDGT